MPAGKKWLSDELRQLAQSWIVVSENPIKGNEQKSTTFWKEIWNHWVNNVSLPKEEALKRTEKALKNKFSDMSHAVNKFAGCYARVTRNKRSGTTLSDWMTEAAKAYQQQMGKNFEYAEAYPILMKSEKFALYASREDRQVERNTKPEK